MFWDRARADSLVPEIKRHIADGGEPFSWWGGTYTKPPAGSKPVYLEEFDLSEKRLKAKRWTPCPCCSPETPKYGRNGKIAWFPTEGVIRLLGPDCFKALDKEGHEAAKRQLETERRLKQDTGYLLSKLPLVRGVITVAESALPIAKALDEFHKALHNKLDLARLLLWDQVRNGGELRIKERSQEFRPGANGTMRVVDVEIERVYAPLPGYEVLNPNLTPCVPKLQKPLRKLRNYDYGEDWRQKLNSLDDREKNKVAKEIAANLTSIKSSLEKLRTLQRFTDRIAINTLRRWGQHDGCPRPYFFEHRSDRIAFGRSEYQSYTIPIPDDLLATIGDVKF